MQVALCGGGSKIALTAEEKPFEFEFNHGSGAADEAFPVCPVPLAGAAGGVRLERDAVRNGAEPVASRRQAGERRFEQALVACVIRSKPMQGLGVGWILGEAFDE